MVYIKNRPLVYHTEYEAAWLYLYQVEAVKQATTRQMELVFLDS